MADVRNSAVLVVSHALYHNGDSCRAVSLIGKGLELGSVALAARTALYGTLDGVSCHVVGKGFCNGSTETRVAGRIAAADSGSGGNLTNELGKNLAALGILQSLAVLNIMPLTMT